jgi:hypothetical protein
VGLVEEAYTNAVLTEELSSSNFLFVTVKCGVYFAVRTEFLNNI